MQISSAKGGASQREIETIGTPPLAKLDLGGYSILQAESKEALAAMMKEHPHLMMPDGTIEIVELMPMPGS